MAINFVALLLCIGWTWYQWSQLKVGGTPSFDTRLADIGLAIFALWGVIVLIRRLLAQANQTSPRRFGWKHLPTDQQRPTRILYVNAVSILSLPLLTITMFLTNASLLPEWWLKFIPTVGILVNTFLFSIIYFNATVSRTTITIRIVGVTLLVIFLILGIAGIAIAQMYSAFIDVYPAAISAQTIRFTPQEDERYTAVSLPPQSYHDWGDEVDGQTITLPFAFPFGQESWSQVSVEEGGVLAFGDWSEPLYAYNYLPAISLYQQQNGGNGRFFINATPDQALVSWQAEGGTDVVQAMLYANGRFDLIYPQLHGNASKRIGFQSGSGGTAFTPFEINTIYENSPIAADGLLTDYAILYQQNLHPLMLPIVALIFSATLLSVLGFPLLFQLILAAPLNALVHGVEEVQAGNLNVQVPIANEDEIGFVTHAFNKMVGAVRDVEQTLETELERRTEKLTDKQRQLGAVEERERIGREIHDDLGQVMGYVHMQIEAAQTRLRQAETDQAEAILAEVDAVALEAHDRVRHYILGIRTGKTQSSTPDFWTALDGYLALAGERYGLCVDLTASPSLRERMRLATSVETQLLRIIQEGITNVYKHAQATAVHLFLTIEDEWLTLLLKDNGRGFERESTRSSDHFGLKIMQERAESVNGRFQLITAPDQGVQLRVRLPCSTTSPSTVPDIHSWRVLLVDDHALFREGLGNMLRPHGVQIVGMAENGRVAETKARELQPDLILMDIHMPEQDGLATTRRLKQTLPHIKIVMLTMAAEEALLLEALKSGASGYLLKTLPAPEFLSLLNDVMAGKTIIAPELATQVLTTLAQQDDLIPSSPSTVHMSDLLTSRQQDVLTCLTKGMSNKQIGEQLYISENTVKYHIKQMMARLQLQTRHELIVYKKNSGHTQKFTNT